MQRKPQTQKVTVRLSVEDYGWLMRYSDQNNLTTSQTLRKALKVYMIAVQRNKKKEV